jgi:hypothetical protein
MYMFTLEYHNKPFMTIVLLLFSMVQVLILSAFQMSDQKEIAVADARNSTKETAMTLKLTVFLEGPFIGTKMSTDLNKGECLPLSQPYSSLPWNYQGTESVESIPGGHIVDWVLVEIREPWCTDGSEPKGVLARKAAFLASDGQVFDLDGKTLISFDSVFG